MPSLLAMDQMNESDMRDAWMWVGSRSKAPSAVELPEVPMPAKVKFWIIFLPVSLVIGTFIYLL